MTDAGSVTIWLRDIPRGCQAAISQLWQRYYPQLRRFAQQRLRPDLRRVLDDEDVAAAALASYLRRAVHGRFPRVVDRRALWRLLLTITQRKLNNQVRDLRSQRRAALRTLGESAFARRAGEGRRGLAQLASAAPEPGAELALEEELQRLLATLEDDLREIALAKLAGSSNREIAAAVGCSLPTVERRLRLIRDRWRAQVGP